MVTPSEIAIAGITSVPKWYSGKLKSIKHTDKIRGDLILYSAKFAKAVGYNVILVDSKSPKTFQKELKKLKVKVVLAKIPKRSPNRRKALFTASQIKGVRAIIMTEIEKVSLITDCIEAIVRPIFEENVDLVIPKREDKLFKKTYPDYMYESEMEGNLLYNEELKAHGLMSSDHANFDVFFGVRVFRNDKKLLKQLFLHFTSNPFNTLLENKLFDIEEYSNSQFFPVVIALLRKKKVVSVTIPFSYPEKQKENEKDGQKEIFILKRRYQRLTIIIELMHFLGFINKKKGRKIKKI